jgi:divalent metal cation (Fe/Co/Zn/Cd) transporter
VFKAMVLDSFLDCAVTLFALMGLFLITKLNFSIDGIFAIIVGIFVTVSAVKNIIEQTKFLINN